MTKLISGEKVVGFLVLGRFLRILHSIRYDTIPYHTIPYHTELFSESSILRVDQIGFLLGKGFTFASRVGKVFFWDHFCESIR